MERKPKINVISSWDDGGYNDINIAPILVRFSIPATFYIPSCTVLQDDEVKQLSAVFEIGGHTATHPPDLKRLSHETLRKELRENRKWLQELTGQKITKFAYPRGRYNQGVIDEVRSAGFEYARTTLIGYFGGEETYRQHTTVHIYPRKEYNGVHWSEYAKEKAIECSGVGGIFHIWGHSDEIEDIGEWDNMIEFFQWLQDNFEVNI